MKAATTQAAQVIRQRLLLTLSTEEKAGILRDWTAEEIDLFAVLLAEASVHGLGVRHSVRAIWFAAALPQSKNEMFSLVRSMRKLAA